MSLYLKYRPKKFSCVVNQSHIVDILKHQADKWNVDNNYLFFGSRWTWKTTVARILAKAVNCKNLNNWDPCNECHHCISINNNKNIDFVEIDAASHTQVENIREEIIQKAPYPPSNLKKKVYIIDEVHMLSKASFNALLKIMEEPPSYLFFILATTELNKVPDTIISRCQIFNFKRLNFEDIFDRILYICKEEKYEYNSEAIELISKYSDGAMRDAIKYLEQLSLFWKVSTDNVVRLLWIVSTQKIEEFINYIKNNNLESSFVMLSDLSKSWIDLSDFAKQLLYYCDENFSTDPKFYSKLSDAIINILKNIKIYPSIIIYKKELYKLFS